MVEKYANAFWTHLTVPMLVGDLTAHVALAAPAALQGGQFRVSIDSELLLVTAATTTTWTVTRGVEGTTAAPHRANLTVAHVLTAATVALWEGATGAAEVADARGTFATLGDHLDSIAYFPSGVAFPAAVLDALWYRPDLHMSFYFNGTTWVSLTLHITPLPHTDGPNPFSGTGAAIAMQATLGLVPEHDVWIEEFRVRTYVGTTNNGSNYWTVALWSDSGTVLAAAVSTAADAANVSAQHKSVGGGLLHIDRMVAVVVTKVGSPGPLSIYPSVSYRIVG